MQVKDAVRTRCKARTFLAWSSLPAPVEHGGELSVCLCPRMRGREFGYRFSRAACFGEADRLSHRWLQNLDSVKGGDVRQHLSGVSGAGVEHRHDYARNPETGIRKALDVGDSLEQLAHPSV